jgi:hypothetical protein
MALACSIKIVNDYSRRHKYMTIEVLPSSSYTTGGDTLNLTAITNSVKTYRGKIGPKVLAIDDVQIVSVPAGYTAQFTPGTTNANHLLQFFTTAATELSQAGYPAGLTGTPTLIRVKTGQNI